MSYEQAPEKRVQPGEDVRSPHAVVAARPSAASPRTRTTRALRAARALGGAGLVVLLTACLGPVAHTVDDENDFRLDADTVAVVGYAPPLNDIARLGSGNRGYLVAIERSGTARVLRTKPVPGVQPNWDGGTVFTRDGAVDRSTTTRGTRSQQDSASLVQVGVYSGVDGWSSIEAYGLGVTKKHPEGSRLFRARNADGTVEEAQVDDDVRSPVACQDGLYGLTESRRAAAPSTEPLPTASPSARAHTTLVREFPRPDNTTDPRADVVAEAAVGDTAVVDAGAGGACVGTHGYVLGVADGAPAASLRSVAGLDEAESGAAIPYLRSWDSATGTIADIPLRRDDGLALNTERAHTGAGAIVGDELYWYAETGTVFASELSTGVTRVAFTTSPEPLNVDPGGADAAESAVEFADGHLYLFTSPLRGRAAGEFTGWDLRSGARTLQVAVPAAAEITAEDRHLQHVGGIAVRPGLARN